MQFEIQESNNLYIYALEVMEKRGINLNPADILSACAYPLQYKEYEPIIYDFCKLVFNECDSDDVQTVILALCVGLRKDYAKKAWKQIFETWVAHNEEEMAILLEQMIKYECLVILLPKESVCDMVKIFSEESDLSEILTLIDNYISDKEDEL